MPRDTRFTRYSSLVEIGLGLLLFFPFYSYGARALVAIVALRKGVREGLVAACCAWAKTRSAGPSR